MKTVRLATSKRNFSVLALSFLFLLLGFQNCTGFSGCSMSKIGFSASEPSSSGGIVGNGEPIDGKPDPGVYYRMVPGFKCDGRPTVPGKITVTEDKIQLQSLDLQTCALNTTDLPLASLEFASYNKSYVGHRGAMFEKIAPRDPGEPRPDLRNYEVTEAWCRSKDPAIDRLDVVVRNDLTSGQLKASLSGNRLPADASSEFAGLQRAGGDRSVQYKATDFALSIQLSDPGATADGAPAKFLARLHAKTPNRSYDEDLLCLTGARFDRVAPASPPSFHVLGVSGGIDNDIDDLLTDGTSALIHWQPVHEAAGYRVALLDESSQTELCSRTFASTEPTTQSMEPCSLARNESYRISVTATTVFGQSVAAANDRFLFGLKPGLCPIGYVRVPSLAPYSTQDFCLAKYEAKNQSGIGVSAPQGLPWVNVSRDEALAACAANGARFDLMSNSEWQTVARNIELVADNWSSGGIGIGALSTGNSNGQRPSPLTSPIDDTDACAGTSETCGLHSFASQKRTLTLSNGARLWDLAGNIWEWMKDDNFVTYGANDYISLLTNSAPFTNQAKDIFGPAGTYAQLNSGTRGGLGYAYIDFANGGIVRGSYWDGGAMSGVFRADTSSLVTARTDRTGFRCVYHP